MTALGETTWHFLMCPISHFGSSTTSSSMLSHGSNSELLVGIGPSIGHHHIIEKRPKLAKLESSQARKLAKRASLSKASIVGQLSKAQGGPKKTRANQAGELASWQTGSLARAARRNTQDRGQQASKRGSLTKKGSKKLVAASFFLLPLQVQKASFILNVALYTEERGSIKCMQLILQIVLLR